MGRSRPAAPAAPQVQYAYSPARGQGQSAGRTVDLAVGERRPSTAGSVQVNPGAGMAELHVRDLALRDYFNIPNALAQGAFVPATVSVDVVWSGPVTRRVNVRDAANDFAGNFAENQATVSFSATEEGFQFQSAPASTSTSVFAEVGHERNGTFFPGRSQ